MVDLPVPEKPPKRRVRGFAETAAARFVRLPMAALVAGMADAASQRRAFILWPFVLIGGLIAYRQLPSEPSPFALISAMLLATALAFAVRTRSGWREPAVLAAIFVAGAGLLPLHGAVFGTDMLQVARYGSYTARIDAVISDDGQDQRWIISHIAGEPDWAVPDIRRARVSVVGSQKASAGDLLAARIRFYPVPAPAVPGGYDSQFISYFDGIGAFGSVLGEAEVIAAEEGGAWRAINRLRNAITQRLVDQLGDRIGGIAAALITGDQSRVTEDDYYVMAQAGIVHVISISGLHLTLVAGTMFACVRFGLALSHRLTQRIAIKKVAAGVGIVTAIAYMLLSGMVIPAVRSTIMLTLVFAAILAGRQALTMRNVAIAGLIIIVFEPSTVFRASFQLSFAAVVALIAGYELAREQREERAEPRGNKAVVMIRDVTITSLIAGLATVVFTAFHFQQTAPFGVLGNLMIMPVVSFIMMPAALFGTLAMLAGVEGPLIALLGWSIEAMLWCAHFVWDLSGGFDPSPILAPAALVVALAALAWLAFFRSRLRLVGPALAVPLIAIFCQERAPDIFVADQTQALAARHDDAVALIAGRNNTFATNVWSERYITQIASSHEGTVCDSQGCILGSDLGYTLALVKDRAAFDEDCRIADIVVTRIAAPPACADAAALVIDASDLVRYGAHMVDWNGPATPPTVRRAIDAPDRPWRPAAQ